jgi:hypothetical protein
MRSNLLKIVQSGCGEREAIAAYWLGFFPSNTNPGQEQAELSALRSLYQNDSPKCDFMARLIAIKSLGLRSAETMDYWATLLRKERQIWLRHQILINAFAHYGRQFAPGALELLATEPSQYIQWQLMQRNIECREGQRFRSYWDIWIPVTLQFLLVFPDPGHQEKMSEADQNQMLHWIESGRTAGRPGCPQPYDLLPDITDERRGPQRSTASVSTISTGNISTIAGIARKRPRPRFPNKTLGHDWSLPLCRVIDIRLS